jgi:hypothetical protein
MPVEEYVKPNETIKLNATLKKCFGSGLDQVSGSGFGIRIQEGKNDPQKYTSLKILCFEVLDVFF